MKMQQDSLFIPLKNGIDILHLKRFYTNPKGVPVFMAHGAMENGRIFYSESGKGLAPWLAAKGYDVFVADFRGRGLSTPRIDKTADFGLKEMQEEDMPAFLQAIQKLKGNMPHHWVAHSWGGVTLLAYLAKHLKNTPLNSLIFFGSKRRISVCNPRKILMINLGWNLLGNLYIKKHGYLNATVLRFGSDFESARSNQEMYQWASEIPWIDWHDGFDYSAALKKLSLPPVLSLTGKGDRVLGHKKDALLLLAESGIPTTHFKILSKKKGNLLNYGHIDILTAPEAQSDHFPMIHQWMQTQEGLLRK